MGKIFKKFLLSFCCVLFTAGLMAQDNQGVEMADLMRSNGKIYIVVAVCLTILVGLFIYLFLIDRKVKKLEKELG